MRLNYTPPQHESEFEILCLKLLQVHWNCPTLELYGRRGEYQGGIDIFDPGGTDPLKAAQCKLREQWKTLSPSEIEDDVNAAKSFAEPIAVFAILTTAKVSTEAQRTIRRINREHRKKGLFQIELFTWDKIKVLLDQYPDVAAVLCRQGDSQQFRAIIEETRLDVKAVRLAVETMKETPEVGAHHAEIDLANKYLEEYQPQIARLILQKLRAHHWDNLDNRERFRVLSNLGASHLQEEDLKSAAAFFWEAKPYQPNDEKACANEALGYQITGFRTKAFELADRYRNEFPASARILAIWLNCAPDEKKLNELETGIPEHLTLNAEVAASLSIKAERENDLAKAEQYARKAIAANEDWTFPQIVLAKIIVQREVTQSRDLTGDPTQGFEAAQLQEAEELCTKAIALATRHKLTQALGEAHSTRAAIRGLIRDRQGAYADSSEAYKLCPNDLAIMREHAIALNAEERFGEAVEVLRSVLRQENNPGNQHLLAVTLRNRNAVGDQDEALQILVQLVESSERYVEGFREHLAITAVNLFCEKQRWADATAFLERTETIPISEVLVNSLRATVYWRQRDQQQAYEFATKAFSFVTSETPKPERRLLAKLLFECGRFNEAMQLWEGLTALTAFDEGAYYYLECARRLERYDAILHGCRTLHNAGVNDGRIIDLEVSVLEKLDVEQAIGLLVSHLGEHPNDKLMRMRLSLIGLRLSRTELVTADPSLLPAIEESDVNIGVAVVRVLWMGGRPNDALAYAYKLLRRNFGDPQSHRAFIHVLHPWGGKPTIEAVDSVSPGTAICYQEKGDASECWIVIEDLPDPDQSRNEVSPQNHLARKFLGKKVGDTVLLAEGAVTDRVATVKDIVNKYVFRYRDCLSQWQLRFPDVPEIEMIRVNSGIGNEEFDPSAILASIDRKHEHVKRLKELYHSQPIPVHMLTGTIGGNAFDAIIALAEREDSRVICCVGSEEERLLAAEAFSNANRIVIDLTALATLAILNGARFLDGWSKQLVISQNTELELRRMVQEAEGWVEVEGGSLSKTEGGYAMTEVSQEVRLERLRKIREFVSSVLKSCKVEPGLILASMDPKKRSTFEKGCGLHGTESMALASVPGTVLWTDDHTLGRLARGEFGANRVWTQLVLQNLVQSGQVDGRDFFEASAKLIGWGYFFTGPSAPILEHAGILANWNPADWPFKQALDLLNDESFTLIDSLRLAASFIVRLYSGTHLSHTQQAVISAILGRIVRRVNGLKGIGAIVESLPDLFGMNVLGCRNAEKDMKAWIRHAKLHFPQI